MTNTITKITLDGDDYIVGGGDVLVSTQANNIFTPGMKIWGGTQSDYQSLTPDSNTAYLLLADQPTPPSPGRQPGVNTIAYYPFKGDAENKVDTSQTATITDGTVGSDYVSLNFGLIVAPLTQTLDTTDAFTASIWINLQEYKPQGEMYYAPRIYGENSRFRMAVETYYQTYNLCLNWSADERNSSYTAQLGLNDWTNIIVTYSGNGNTIYLYKNGVKYTYPNGFDANNSVSNFIIGTNYPSNQGPKGYIADFIIENVQWSDQEVSDYYDQTKANYGIS